MANKESCPKMPEPEVVILGVVNERLPEETFDPVDTDDTRYFNLYDDAEIYGRARWRHD